MPRQAEKPRRASERPDLSSNSRRAPEALHGATPSAPGAGASMKESAVARAASRRRRGWLAAGGAAALALAGGLIWSRWRAPASTPTRTPPGATAADSTEQGLLRAVETRPGDAKARLALAAYYQGTARPFEAMWEFAEARRLAPSDPDAALGTALVLRSGRVIDVALAELTDAVKARPDDLKARAELADLYLARAEPKRALATMEQRRSAGWADADALAAYGRALQANGDTEGAVAAFKQAVKLREADPEAWYRLGRCYLVMGRNDEARDALTHAMFGYGSRPETPYYLGMTYMQRARPGDMDRAISFFKDALAVKPSFAPAHYQAGLAQQRKGKLKEALSHYSFAILADTQYAEPNLPLARGLAAEGQKRDAHRYRGRYYDLKDRPEAAVREFLQMGKPGNGQTALMAGQVYLRSQQNEKAVAMTEAALKKDPDSTALLERLAVLKINRGDRPYARKLLHRWLKLNPKASAPCWLLGRCDFGDLKYAEGVAWLEKAVAAQPRNPHYLGFLGGGLMRLGTPESRERAAQVLAQAVERAPDNAEYRDLYGQVLMRLGRSDEARRQFLQALNADPFRISCFTPVGQLAWRLKAPGAGEFFPRVTRSVQQRVSEENVLWPHTWRHPRDADGHLKLARFFCRNAELTKARDHLEQAIELRPAWPEAKQLLTTVQRSMEAQ
jgi:tetratricopeptide (TPR) repeat protein